MNGRLPNITGSSSSPQFQSNDVPFGIDMDREPASKFERSIEKLSQLGYPQLNPVASVKNRIQTLENIADIQSSHNKTTHESFINLSEDLSTTDQTIRDLLLQMQNSFDLKLNTLKKEYDHRFELQSSENKRLQNHVSSLKSDTSQLKRKLQSTSDKLRKLQQEFGDPDETLEEDSMMMSATGGDFSRPNTTN